MKYERYEKYKYKTYEATNETMINLANKPTNISTAAFPTILFLIGAAFFLSLLIYRYLIPWCRVWQSQGQPIRDDGPETHLLKRGTPTMGGVGIIAVFLLLFASNSFWWGIGGGGGSFFSDHHAIITLLVFLSYGAIGFVDDRQKLKSRTSRGLPGKKRLKLQFLLAFIAIIAMKVGDFYSFYGCGSAVSDGGGVSSSGGVSLVDYLGNCGNLNLPWGFNLQLGWLYYFFTVMVLVGSANAINLTDGLDGLVSVPVATVLAYFIVIALAIAASGEIGLNGALNGDIITKGGIKQASTAINLAYLCAIIIGSCLGFLWFNAQPAKIFMGDVGSLALGGFVGSTSISLNAEIALFFAGGLFVIEAVSVILQVASYRLRDRRIFRMAPIHHHFEKLGWPESLVVIRFWIFSLLCTMLSAALFL